MSRFCFTIIIFKFFCTIQINKKEQGGENARVDTKTEIGNQMLLKALENPDGFVRLIEAAGKAQQLTKGQRK